MTNAAIELPRIKRFLAATDMILLGLVGIWRSFVFAVLDALAEFADHRMVGMVLWISYFGIQDLLKDPDVQTLIASPASISTWESSTYLFICFKALIPMIGGFIAYKSDSWAKKGRKAEAEIAATKE